MSLGFFLVFISPFHLLSGWILSGARIRFLLCLHNNMLWLVMNLDKGHNNRWCTYMVIQILNDNKSFPFSEYLSIIQCTSLQMTSPVEDNMGSVLKVDWNNQVTRWSTVGKNKAVWNRGSKTMSSIRKVAKRKKVKDCKGTSNSTINGRQPQERGYGK